MTIHRTRIVAALVAVVCLGYPVGQKEATARQREQVKGRTPFQIFLSESLKNPLTLTYFHVPTGRRLEIHNVNTVLHVSELDYQVEILQCQARTLEKFPGDPDTKITGELPLVMKQVLELPPGVVLERSGLVFHAMQPTLFHVTGPQRVECYFEPRKVTSYGFVNWTISGFMDDAP